MGADPRLRAVGHRPGLGHARADGASARRSRRSPRRSRRRGWARPPRPAATRRSRSPRSTFQKGAGLPAAIAFMFASTNLVFEIGIVLWIFLGPEFTAAEFAGGLLLILLMWVGVRLFVSAREEEQVREHARAEPRPATGTRSPRAGARCARRSRSVEAWSDVAHNFRGDWQMLWKEVTLGFLIAGFVALLPESFFQAVFLDDAPPALKTAQNVLVGPLIAVLSFVCSIGNIPLAAVLWAGGISFAGVHRVHLRRPDHAADPARLPQVLRHPLRPQAGRTDARGDRHRRARHRRHLLRRRARSPRAARRSSRSPTAASASTTPPC